MSYDKDDFGSTNRGDFDGVQEISAVEADQVAGGFGFSPGGAHTSSSDGVADSPVTTWAMLFSGGWSETARWHADMAEGDGGGSNDDLPGWIVPD